MNALSRRCIDLSYKHKLTHISSVLNAVNVIADIYARRQSDEPFILGPSHAALALFVVLESVGKCDAEEMIAKHGTHASRDLEHGIYVSGGSLGQAETIAVGMAMADVNKKVWLVTSDGALAEGCIWESLAFAHRLGLTNLKTTVIANGLGGYGRIDVQQLRYRLSGFPRLSIRTVEPVIEWPFLQGLAGHYIALTQEQYEGMAA